MLCTCPQHRIYNVSRGLIVTYALLYGAFAFDKGDGLQLHYVLLAWVLSLTAQFKSKPSIIFLALCTGVFMQGFGAYRLRCVRVRAQVVSQSAVVPRTLLELLYWRLLYVSLSLL